MDDVTNRGDTSLARIPARARPPEGGADAGADLDHERWRRLLGARNAEEAADTWLVLLAAQLTRMTQGVVALVGDDGAIEIVGNWPKGSVADPGTHALIERAVAQKKTLMQRGSTAPGAIIAALPVNVDENIRAAVAITFVAGGEADPLSALRPVQWSLAWIEVALRRAGGAGAPSSGDTQALLDIVSEAATPNSARRGALAVVTELARRLDCDRVTLGLRRGLTTRPYALSHSATFGRRTQLMRAVAQAMDEAIDQGVDVAFPPGQLSGPAARQSHEALVRNHGSAHVLTAPFGSGSRAGAFTFERKTDRPFTRAEIALCRNVARIVGPSLRTRHDAERPLYQIVFTRLWRGLSAIVGPHYLAVKLLLLTLAAALVVTIVIPIEHRVSANAMLEGTVRRVISAPFEGYIGETFAKSGDVVKKDGLLARLDDRDLQIERAKWSVEATKHRQKFVESLSENQRAEALLARAKLDQANAQLELLDSMLARTRLTAPFDGTVVTGDLSQSLGAAVSRGQALFEMAPLGSYRVKLKVDERDIADLTVGQKGELTLAPFPTEVFPIEVERITLVSTPEDGLNYFAVEAKITGGSLDALRPGMAGLGKVEVGQRSIFWIYTHRLINTVRLWLWSL